MQSIQRANTAFRRMKFLPETGIRILSSVCADDMQGSAAKDGMAADQISGQAPAAAESTPAKETHTEETPLSQALGLPPGSPHEGPNLMCKTSSNGMKAA